MAVRAYLRSGTSIIARRANELWYRRRLKVMTEDLQQELAPNLRQYVENLSLSQEMVLPTDRAVLLREIAALIGHARQRFQMPFEPRRTAEYMARLNQRATDAWWVQRVRGWVEVPPSFLPQPRIGDAAPRRLRVGTIHPLATLHIVRGQESIDAAFSSLVENNIELIESIPRRYFENMEEVLFEQVSTAERWEDMADRLREGIGQVNNLSNYQVELIARDQSAKAAAAFNRARSESVGIDSYTWQTAGDERVRETHAANDGKVFRFDDPPEETGNPGDDVNCRCAAVPNVMLEEEAA